MDEPRSYDVELAQEDARHTCAGCLNRIPDDHEVYGIMVRVKPRTLYNRFAGQVVAFHLMGEGRTIPAIVTAVESEAKKKGIDLAFQVCSAVCATSLREVLEEEFDFIET